MKSKLVLSKKKRARVEAQKPSVIKGAPLTPNAAVQNKYADKLAAMVNEMVRKTRKEIEALFRNPAAKEFFAEDESIASHAKAVTDELSERFSALFAERADSAAASMVEGAKKSSSTTLLASLRELSGGVAIKTSMVPEALVPVVQASVAENVGLIRSISSDYMQKVEGAVMRSITTGNGLEDLIPSLEKLDGMTKRRAENIAYDQTRKVYNNVNKARMQAVGVKKFEWLHTGGSQHPRKDHIALSGKVFSFDNLPVIDPRTGERGIPGQAPNCRCRMVPVIEFADDDGDNEDDANAT